jgi:hypothetical protein
MRDGRESDGTAYIPLGGRTRISLDIGDLEAHNPGKVHIQRPQTTLVSVGSHALQDRRLPTSRERAGSRAGSKGKQAY